MTGCLRGKKALITGGSRGIGHALALTFRQAGAEVVVSYNTTPCDGVQADFSTLERVDAFYRRPRGSWARSTP